MKAKRSDLVVAFIGLGRMGSAMAARLVMPRTPEDVVSGKKSAKKSAGKTAKTSKKTAGGSSSGVSLRVWNRTAKRAEPFRKLGAFVASTPRECALGADIVVTMLADKDALAEVMIGHDGLLSGLARGALVIDMSTIGRAGAVEASKVVKSAGARFVDAPVSGTIGPAKAGALVALVGGASKDVERAETVLRHMCSKIVRAGGVGQGQALKVILNGVGAYHFVGFAAMLALGEKAGLARAAILDAFTTGAFASPSYIAKRDKVLARNYAPDFTLALAWKDAVLNVELQRETKMRIPSQHELVREIADAVEAGLGELDLFALEKHFSKR